jgi:hypothetical protein
LGEIFADALSRLARAGGKLNCLVGLCLDPYQATSTNRSETIRIAAPAGQVVE